MSEQWKSIWMATKVKLKSNHGFMLTVLLGVAFLYSIEIVMLPREFLKGEHTFIEIDSVFQGFIFSYSMMLLLMYTWSMSVAQEKMTEGYPISSTIQFWSNKLVAVLWWIAILTLTVISYLIRYGLCVYLSEKISYSFMGYEFSVEAIVVGFVVQLVYGMMAIAFLGFLKYCTILSKGWTLLGLVAVIGGSIVVTSLESSSLISIVDVVKFYAQETSIAVFLVKGIITTAALLAVSLRLRGIAEKRRKIKSKQELIIAVIILIIVALAVTSMTTIGIVSSGSMSVEEFTENRFDDGWKEAMANKTFTIPVTDLVDNEVLVIHEDLLGEFYLAEARHYEGKEIEVRLYAEAKEYDGVSIAPLVKVDGSGEIIDNEVHIYGEIDDSGTMVLLAPFTIPNEFSRYEGRKVFDQIGTSYGGGRGEWVEVLIPEEIQYEVRS